MMKIELKSRSLEVAAFLGILYNKTRKSEQIIYYLVKSAKIATKFEEIVIFGISNIENL